MARELVDRTSISLNGQKLAGILSASVDVEDGTQPVSTLTPDRIDIGFMSGNRKVTAEMEAIEFAGAVEVDWRSLQDNRALCLIGYADLGGKRRQMVDARITKLSKKYGTDGEVRWSISWAALNDREVR